MLNAALLQLGLMCLESCYGGVAFHEIIVARVAERVGRYLGDCR